MEVDNSFRHHSILRSAGLHDLATFKTHLTDRRLDAGARTISRRVVGCVE